MRHRITMWMHKLKSEEGCKEKKIGSCLDHVAQLVVRYPAKQNIASLIPGQASCPCCRFGPIGTDMRGNLQMFPSHINIFPFSFSLPSPLSKNK